MTPSLFPVLRSWTPRCAATLLVWLVLTTALTAQSADLSVQVTDGLTEATPGASATYTVQVLNAGPDDADGVVVSDIFPASLSCLWTCVGSGGAGCTPGQVNGNINDSFDMPSGAVATYTAQCHIAADAEGLLQNSATVLTPAGVTDPDENNNMSSDGDTLLVPRFDVQLSKTDGRDDVVPGETLIYQLDVSHSGPSDAVGLRLRDTLPEGLGNVQWTCQASAGSSCTSAGSGDLDDLATLRVGGQLQYRVDATVESNASGSLFNLATLAVPGGAIDTNPSNNGDSDTTVVDVQLDLRLEADVDPDSVVPGEMLAYMIELHNDGPADATGAQLSVSWPGALQTLSWSCIASGGAACPASGGSGSILSLVDLPVGSSLSFELESVVDPNATEPLQLTAVAQAAADTTDPQGANNQVSVETPVTPQASVAVLLDSDADSAVPGQDITYSLQVTQDGPSHAPGVVLSSPTDDATQCLWTCTASGGAVCPAGPVQGDVHLTLDLPPTSALDLTVVCDVDAAAVGDLLRSAELTVPAVEDLDFSDNTAQLTTPLTPRADLAVTKTDGLSQVAAGTSTTYTLEVTNLSGPSEARQVTVRDVFVESLDCTWTCIGQAGGLCTPGQVAGDIDDVVQLPVGSRVTYTAHCAIAADTQGDLINGVSLTLPPGLTDPNGSNNSALDNTEIEPAVDLALQLDDGSTVAVPGTYLDYVLTVDNLGITDADGAEVRSLWPDMLTCTWGCVAGPGATCTAGQVVGDLVDIVQLPAGSQVVYTASCEIDPAATGVLAHQASVEPPAGVTDLQPGNNQASDLDTRLEPHADLAILKTDGLVAVEPGGELTYTVTVSNTSGPSAAVGATVEDVLPEVVDCTWSCAVSGGATCSATPPAGDLNDLVDLPVGSLAVYTATCTVVEDAETSPVNTATVTPSPKSVDPDLDNNSATDDDTVLVNTVDLRVTLENDTEAVAGRSVHYTLEASHPAQLLLRTQTPRGVQLYQLDLPMASSPTPSSLGLTPLDPAAARRLGSLHFSRQVEHPLDGRLIELAQTQTGASLRLEVDGDAVATRLELDFPSELDSLTLQGMAVAPTLGGGARVQNQTSPNLQCTWTCSASADGQCTEGPVIGPLDDLVELPLGATLTYLLDCQLPSDADGAVLHSTTLAPPPGVEDRQPNDNVASVELPVGHQADLQITKTDGRTEASPGTDILYTLVASNPVGPSDVLGAQVVDLFSAELDCLWSCQGLGGAVCTPGQVSGDIQDTIDLPVGSSATYTAQCSIHQGAQGNLSNTADLLAPDGMVELDGSNNQASDLDTVLVPTADLTLQIDAEPSAVPGTFTAWTLAVDNHGPSDVHDATVESLFPQGWSCLWGCSATGGGVCTPGQVAGDLLDVIDLPVGSRATYSVQCDLSPSLVGTAELLAHVAPPIPGNDPHPEDNSAQVELSLLPTADLRITKDDGVEVAYPGGTVTYEISVRNRLGPSDLVDVIVHDPLDAALSHCSWSCQGSGGGQCGTALPDGTLGDTTHLPKGSEVVYTGHCSVATTATGSLVNVASLTLPEGSVDPNPADNTASDVDDLVPRLNLRVDLDASAEEVTAGESLIYSLEVANVGPSPALGATVQTTVTDDLACVWTCLEGGGACASEPVHGHLLDFVDLGPGAALHYEASCDVDPAIDGPLQTSAQIEVPAGAEDTDPTDNLDSVQVMVQRRADLSITKDDGQDSAQPGESVVYAIRIHNHGPSQVDDAVVEDLFHADLTCSWTCAPDIGVQCREGTVEGDLQDILTLPPGLGALYSADCVIGVGATGELVNQASVHIDGEQDSTEDPDLANNVATDIDVLGNDADLALSLNAEPDPVASGNLLLYRARVDNFGPLADGAVQVTMLLPDGSQWLTAFVGDPGLLFRDGFESGDTSAWQTSTPLGDPNPCSQQGNQLLCLLGTLAADGNLDLVVVVEVLAEDGATLVATATVSGGGTDPVSNNNTDSAITQVGSEAGPSTPEALP